MVKGPRDSGQKVREILVKGPRDIGQRSERFWSVTNLTIISRTLTKISRTFQIDQYLSDL